MTMKERLFAISVLKNAIEIERMDDSQLKTYIQKLNEFIERFPVMGAQIKIALKENDKAALVDNTTVILDLLTEIYANEIVEMGRKQINLLREMNDESIEAFVNTFISKVSMFSIDIQMAVYMYQEDEIKPEDDGEKEIDNAQPMTDVVTEVNEQSGKRAAEQVAKQKEKVSTEDGPSILAVDDARFFLNNLKMLLKDSEYKLTCVPSGKMALQFLAEHSPSLFILDIDMPEMNGYELAGKIRELGHKAPIIFLTGNARKEYVLKAMLAGASDFIVKPISREEAMERIEKALESYKPE